MNKCKCSLRERAVGDGCEACNPAMAEELRREARVARLVEALEKIMETEWWGTGANKQYKPAGDIARTALDEWRWT